MSLVPAGTIAAWLPPALRDAPPDGDGAFGRARLLDALLAAVDAQFQLLADDIDRVWEDLFIESCAPGAVPYLATLVGLHAGAERAEVAAAIRLRRRKGTPAALRDFAEVLTGLSTRVVEGWRVTLWSQRHGYPPPARVAAVDVRNLAAERVGTPFERARRSFTPGGRFAPAAAAAIVWPWQAFTYPGTQALPLAVTTVSGSHRYALHPLGVQAPLYLRPRSLTASAPADELAAPVRVRRRRIQALAGPGDLALGGNWTVGPSHPLATPPGGNPPLISLTWAPPGMAVGAPPVPVDWAKMRFGLLPTGLPALFEPAPDQALVDVDRGTVELGSGFAAGGTLRALWHRPAAGSLGALAGAGQFDSDARVVITVNPALPSGDTVVPGLNEAIDAALSRVQALGLKPDPFSQRPDVEIRLETSDRLASPTRTIASALPNWRIVASALAVPTLVGTLALDLPGGTLQLDGMYLAGSLTAGPATTEVRLRNVTMDPTQGATITVVPAAGAGSLGAGLVAERCLLAPIRAGLGASVRLTDCVVDGRGHHLTVPGDTPSTASVQPAVAIPPGAAFGAALRASGVTFAGTVQVDSVDAVDCLFADGVDAGQPEQGCVRSCYLGPSGAGAGLTAYRCGPFPAPTFTSMGFEAAGYYALDLEPDHPLLSAASDGGEVGAYHHARRTERLARLRQRIHEFVPLGVDALVALAPWEE